MINKLIKNELNFLNKKLFEYSNSNHKNTRGGIVYTLYSDRLNLLEIGFAENKNILNNKLIKEKFILLDQKNGSQVELDLLIETLKQLGVSLLNNKYFKYRNSYLRHLNTLGWPIGKSLYKQKLIRKKLFFKPI